MIESGTHAPGVSAAEFGLPPHTALRYERPASALRPFLASYVVLDSEPVDPPMVSEWLLPGCAQIWIIVTRSPVAVKVRKRRYNAMPVAVLYGATSCAIHAVAAGGVSVGIDISPLGWARLFHQPAETFRDRVTPLEQLMSPALVQELTSSLSASDMALDVKDVLDSFFSRHMAEPHRDEPAIARLMELVGKSEMGSIEAAAASSGIPAYTLRRLSRRYFGFPPKTLMMRTRFLRAFLPILLTREPMGPRVVPSTYFDDTHFLRDAGKFLGMTPRQFIALGTPFLRAALRARLLVLGAPVPVLDCADTLRAGSPCG